MRLFLSGQVNFHAFDIFSIFGVVHFHHVVVIVLDGENLFHVDVFSLHRVIAFAGEGKFVGGIVPCALEEHDTGTHVVDP